MAQNTGKIICIDGPDGSGKTTQVELLKTYLQKQGYDVYTTRNSGGTPIGEELRKASLSPNPRHPEVDVYISLAMGVELGYDVQKHRDEGQIVLVDRSPLAVIAYNTFGSKLENKPFGFSSAEKLLRQWQIDTILLMEAPQDVLDARRKARTDKPSDYFEQQPPEYYERVQEGYKQAAMIVERLPELSTEVQHIDASGSVDDIQRALQLVVKNLLTV